MLRGMCTMRLKSRITVSIVWAFVARLHVLTGMGVSVQNKAEIRTHAIFPWISGSSPKMTKKGGGLTGKSGERPFVRVVSVMKHIESTAGVMDGGRVVNDFPHQGGKRVLIKSVGGDKNHVRGRECLGPAGANGECQPKKCKSMDHLSHFRSGDGGIQRCFIRIRPRKFV